MQHLRYKEIRSTLGTALMSNLSPDHGAIEALCKELVAKVAELEACRQFEADRRREADRCNVQRRLAEESVDKVRQQLDAALNRFQGKCP